MIKCKNIITVAVVIIAVLSSFFFCNSNFPTHKNGQNIEFSPDTHLSKEENIELKKETAPPINENIENNSAFIDYNNASQPNKKTDANSPSVQEENLSCTLTVSCYEVLENLQYFDKNKLDIVPKNGIIFENKNAVFYEGESVFNVLSRELKKNKIHFEFTKTPMYNSVYIEGIGNLYEHDCGDLSGWLYTVNGQSPNIGCSQYILSNTDVIEFMYTRDYTDTF